ncbi:azoreductase [Spiroplasma sabaudiense Ar-1343]|uniref:FMN dependent NADH:quinone oxidoreductase n=1 Tax=Spiroplasma sabaudiense Ar-1343 TaxID=1276257 RepID=W6AAZ1_9MOLU|nr:FMN-dependent NADH-azoreductase [Spiroplasma sabaudiense]AHI54176.1 azoreductase [Spiroplasma sabaudiense Ar-1343]
MKNKVLVINGSVSSPDKSFSVALSNLFIEEYLKKDPEAEIINLDLNNEPMAQISLNSNNIGTFFNKEDSIHYIEQLKNVSKVIINCPMNNFAVTGIVKNYLDHILMANETFSYKYSKKGDAVGLLPHLNVQILTTQGAPLGWYPFGNHTEYLRGTWEFVGAKVNPPILLAGTKLAPTFNTDPKTVALSMIEEIKKAVATF